MYALHKAAEANDVAKIRQLLQPTGWQKWFGGRVDVNQPDENGKTPLHYAVAYQLAQAEFQRQHLRGVRMYAGDNAAEVLLRHGASANVADPEGVTPLHIACSGAHVEIVARIVESGAEIDRKSRWGRTPLHLAAFAGSCDACRVLVDKGANVNSADANGVTPLMAACANGHVAAANVLLAAGADPGPADTTGVTPLHMSAARGNTPLILRLLEAGATFEVDQGGETPLNVAAATNQTEAARALLSKGADPCIPNAKGFTPLHRSCQSNNLELTRALLGAGAAVGARTSDGWTPLHESVIASPELVALLLDHGADPNAQSVNGYTCLHRAAGKGMVAVVDLLLRRGANPGLVDSDGASALDFARQSQSPPTLELVEGYLKAHDQPQTQAADPVVFEGGGGLTMEDAVRVKATHSGLFIQAEYRWLEEKFGRRHDDDRTAPPSQPGWTLTTLSIREQQRETYDEFSLKLDDGTSHTIFFRTTGVYDGTNGSLGWLMSHLKFRKGT